MRVTYDPEADALYISLSDGTRDSQREVNENMILDLNKDGEVVGIEILDAKETYGREIMRMDFSLLGDFKPESEQLFTPEDAAKIIGVNKETILRKIRIGELPAARPGKSYLIKKTDLNKLL